jgi:hypothetical protein
MISNFFKLVYRIGLLEEQGAVEIVMKYAWRKKMLKITEDASQMGVAK